jgi:hypothetical protein
MANIREQNGPGAAYVHANARLRWDIADRLNAFLWASNETKSETDDV